MSSSFFFFFQAEDGIRDFHVTGVQTCALPICLHKKALGRLDAPTRSFLVEAADAAAARWREQDQGIWEVRGPPRDFLHSKLMCWVALDRAIGLADLLHATDRVADWEARREQIRTAILAHGWSDRAGAYAQAFGSDDLDASSLMLAITGFLPAVVLHVTATT